MTTMPWRDGASIAGRGAIVRSIVNPATLELLDTVTDSSPEDVADAVAASRLALPAWAQMGRERRAACLASVAGKVRERTDELVALLVREGGAPRREAREDVETLALGLEAAAAGPAPSAAGERAAPHIVAASLADLDPLLQWVRVAAPALRDGHALIVKPPAHAPLGCLFFAALHDGLPAGVLGLVTGETDVTTVLGHFADVRTADPEELSGAPSVHPILVLEGAELELAARGIAWSRLRRSGQRPDAVGPVLVIGAHAAELADRLHECLAFLEVGDPARYDTDLGPLVTREATLRIERQVAQAAKAGAMLKLGGRGYQPWGLPGHFFQPTLLTEVHADNPFYRARMAGPVLGLTPVSGVDEAVRRARELLPAGIDVYAGREVSLPGDLPISRITARDPRWFPYAAS